MTPKEKAKELVNKFIEYTKVFDDCEGWVEDIISAKQCALIAVDELIKAFEELSIEESGRIYMDFGHGYWQEVKQEIENL